MREVVVVCRSRKKARAYAARTLDSYFWRIADRAWRGKASNACLDRVSRELRAKASRNTAIAIYEIRSAHESRAPLVKIGSRSAFAESGLCPIASRPARLSQSSTMSATETTGRAVVEIAALFHDAGKMMVLFQEMLARAMAGESSRAFVRHELFSAHFWDRLFGGLTDPDLIREIKKLVADPLVLDRTFRQAWEETVQSVAIASSNPTRPLNLSFWAREGSIAQAVGGLVVTHHRLPDGDSDLVSILASRHVAPYEGHDLRQKMSLAPGKAVWESSWWQAALGRSASRLIPDTLARASVDLYFRAGLMLADHAGSAAKERSEQAAEHLANTISVTGGKHSQSVPADSLELHTRRVYRRVRHSFDLFHRYRNGYPALDDGSIPPLIAAPTQGSPPRFRWQYEAARAAGTIAASKPGGFFACLSAGTGTGKTRAAPTILAQASLNDAISDRRYLRFSLGLGLRVLASQSAKEYVNELGFSDSDVGVLVGQVPLQHNEDVESSSDGSESLIEVPEWLRAEYVDGTVPHEGAPEEEGWISRLSKNTDRHLPAYAEILLRDMTRSQSARTLLEAPVLVCTVDHLMWVASPLNSRFLIPAIRMASADLILDEIDAFDGEDLAAVARLVFQAGAGGRRVILMSATLPRIVAISLYKSYLRGWERYAESTGTDSHVHVLVSGDAPGSCVTNADCESFESVFDKSVDASVRTLKQNRRPRLARILPKMESWSDLVKQVDATCSLLHNVHSNPIGEFKVSVGLVKMTRIKHTVAMAAQLPTGLLENGHFRVFICLHSRFPRLHRSWIESQLKAALTRKGPDPNEGLRRWLIEHEVLRRASDEGCTEIEVLVVCSPVIETGNDLDFDYGVVDPLSLRSIVQVSGRVFRHREIPERGEIIAILGAPTVALETGAVRYPGVETPMVQATKVPRRSLERFPGRNVNDLLGDLANGLRSATSNNKGLITVDSRWVYQDFDDVPWREEEDTLLADFLSGCADFDPLGAYLQSARSRLSRQPLSSRVFRRNSAQKYEYALFQEDEASSNLVWRVNLAPGTKNSKWFDAAAHNLTTASEPEHRVFRNVLTEAHESLGPKERKLSWQILSSTEIDRPGYSQELEAPRLTFCHTLGFSDGTNTDRMSPFGRETGPPSAT